MHQKIWLIYITGTSVPKLDATKISVTEKCRLKVWWLVNVLYTIKLLQFCVIIIPQMEQFLKKNRSDIKNSSTLLLHHWFQLLCAVDNCLHYHNNKRTMIKMQSVTSHFAMPFTSNFHPILKTQRNSFIHSHRESQNKKTFSKNKRPNE